ncbi:MAG: GntR family transcriptional regulator [Deltaproteobacteria bacterium]|nr:GntR family transcriptional regulator [Deltaproteobacteria bacterium]MBW2657982.1 GntR family transcriptional regulator [Deltaproteobacteria bacterium]
MTKKTALPDSGNPLLPKYKKIKIFILEGISSRSFTDELPSENRLADFFSVSRMTARKAMDELEREGHITRINGKGSFIKKKKHYSGFFRVRPFKQWAKDINVELTTEVLEASVVETPVEISHLLGSPEQVILIRRLDFFDSLPVRYAIHHLRTDMAAGILMEDLSTKSIHDLVANKYRIDITTITQDLNAIGLSGKTADLFKVSPGYPAFHFKRLEISGDRPVSCVEYFMRGEISFRDTFTPGEGSSY